MLFEIKISNISLEMSQSLWIQGLNKKALRAKQNKDEWKLLRLPTITSSNEFTTQWLMDVLQRPSLKFGQKRKELLKSLACRRRNR